MICHVSQKSATSQLNRCRNKKAERGARRNKSLMLKSKLNLRSKAGLVAYTHITHKQAIDS